MSIERVKTADAINSLPDGVATDRTPRSTPAGVVASAPVGPLEELHALAVEIADECEAGEWVPWGTLRKYRKAKRRLAK